MTTKMGMTPNGIPFLFENILQERISFNLIFSPDMISVNTGSIYPGQRSFFSHPGLLAPLIFD